MTAITINEATLTPPGVNDYLPMQRVGDSSAFRVRALLGEHSVNVKDYGAAGDGVTDDTAAIQAAFDVADRTTTGGGLPTRQDLVVFFPNGRYVISTSLDATDRADFHLLGESLGAILVFKCTGKAGLDFSGTGYSSIRNLTLEGDLTSVPSCAYFNGRTTATHGANTFNNVIEDVYVYGKFSVGGLILFASEMCTFRNVRCYAPSTGGFGNAALIFMAHNEFSMTSDYATLAADPNTMALGWIYNCQFTAAANTLACVYLGDLADQQHFQNSFMYNSAANAECCVKIAGTHYALTFRDLLFEVQIADVFKHVTYAGSTNTVDTLTMEMCSHANFTRSLWYGETGTIAYHSRFLQNRTGKAGTIMYFDEVDECFFWGNWDRTSNDITITTARYNTFGLPAFGTVTITTSDHNWVWKDGQAFLLYSDGGGSHFSIGAKAEANTADITRIKRASASWTPGTIANGASASVTVSCTNVALGDFVIASLSVYTDGLKIHAHVLQADQVRVIVENATGDNWIPGAITVAVIAIHAASVTL